MTSPICPRGLRLVFGLLFCLAYRVLPSNGAADATPSLRLQHFTLQQLQVTRDSQTHTYLRR